MKTIIILLLIAALAMPAMALNNPPVAPSLTGPVAGSVGRFYFYVATATDPDGNQLKYTFDWGDGTFGTSTRVASGTSSRYLHYWTAPGIYVVKAKATDSLGAVSPWSAPLSVNIGGVTPPIEPPVPPVTTNTPPREPYTPVGTTAGYADKPYTYSVYALDPDNDQVKYTFDWGDETRSTTSLVNSGIEASVTHSWSVPPNTILDFNVRAMATDEHGAISGWSNVRSVRIHGPVVNYRPTVATKPSGPTSGVAGTSYSYTTKATDPDNGDQIQYIFAWGDGSTTTGYYASGATATTSHSWYVPAGLTGTFNVRVIAVDWHGLCSDPTWSESLSVTITGSSVQSVQATELKAESDQIIDIQTEADKAIDTPNEEPVLGSFSNDFNSSSIDVPTEEPLPENSSLNESV